MLVRFGLWTTLEQRETVALGSDDDDNPNAR